MLRGFLWFLILACPAFAQDKPIPPPPAEAANYAVTTRHADVQAYCDTLATSPRISTFSFGTTTKGQKLPALVIAPTKTPTPAAATARGKPVVLVFANIHAGEVDGKEALLALARDFAVAPADDPLATLLEAVTIVLVPNLNADGNEPISDQNRTDQNGPPAVGQRENAQGLDLNRDFVKLESPEIRALVALITAWDPVTVIDCHTTNGSFHRYTLTHDGPRNPAAGPIVPAAEPVLDAMSRRVNELTGFHTFAYGDFTADHTKWVTYPALPRYGVQYFGLRGVMGLLSESYTYASFPDRVKATHAFVRAGLEQVAADPAAAVKRRAEARELRPRVSLRTKVVARPTPDTLKGFVKGVKSSQELPTAMPQDYQTTRIDVVEATLETPTPAAYVVPPGHPEVVHTLQRHGIQVSEIVEDLDTEVGTFTVTEAASAARPFQNHSLRKLEGKPGTETRRIIAGSTLISTAQPLGNLAAYLLEPQAEDGLAAWNFFDAAVKVGKPFPVVKLAKIPEIQTTPAASLPEQEPTALKPVTVDVVLLSRRLGVGAGGGPLPEWLPDGEHYLQTRGRQFLKVHARTGRAEPLLDRNKLIASLRARPDVPNTALWATLRRPFDAMNPARTARLVTAGHDLVLAFFDGSRAVRLSTNPDNTPAPELMTFSPDGQSVAYVRGGDLYAATLKENSEIRLTTDGNPTAQGVLNGKADWVYEEEIFNRSARAFWWHPTEPKLVFMRFDDKPVTPFHITKVYPTVGALETIPYPKAGEPNPHVSVHVVDVVSRLTTKLNLNSSPASDLVIARVGWLSGGADRPAVPFAYVQNRTQTWLDFVTWPDGSDVPITLFRDATGAWVEDLGEPHVLKNGDFLIQSERAGWKHIYRFTPSGELIGAITEGEWEAQSLERVDEEAGCVYVTGTREGPTRVHLYRAALDGSGVTRVTPPGGTHAVRVAPRGPLYLDRASDPDTPPMTKLHELTTENVVRIVNAAPYRGLKGYKLGKSEHIEIPLKDGFVLNGVLTYPPDFDPAKKYPLWVLTYAGPHAPTVRDTFSPRLTEHAIAGLGVVALNVDPRSASGQGAASAWTCYKRFGVQELRDLEAAVARVGERGWLDAKRVGISGHSYGGFMAAYALTHGSTFTAGVAGAPVTDFRLYDTIYTERYMGLPQENAKGYDETSVVKAAKDLHGRLLICHGMIDDNVHFQNTAQLVEAFQRAGKMDFEVAIYPTARHGIPSPHYLRSQMDFIRRTMIGNP